MKKLYTLTLAAAVAISATATGRQQIAGTVPAKKALTAASAKISGVTIAKTMADEAITEFTTIDDLAGEYDWNYYGCLTGDSGAKTGALNIEVTDATAGEISISGFPQNFVVKATVDLEAGTVAIENGQDLGTDSYGDQNYFYIKDVDAEGNILDGKMDIAETVGNIDGLTITFPETEIWAIGDFNDESLGWWKLTAENSMTLITDVEDPYEGWEDYCEAEFVDGWIIPGLKYPDGTYADPNDFPFVVNIQKSLTEENLYRIDNPYNSEDFPVNGSGKPGFIVFDATYPDYVVVMPNVYSGYNNGSNKIFCVNKEGFYLGFGYDRAIVEAAEEEQGEQFFERSTISEDGLIINFPRVGFNWAGVTDKYYTWGSATVSQAANMNAVLTLDKPLAGAEGIMIDSSNVEGAAEYFNLQGVRVANPSEGNLYIVRQGGKTTKVVR